MWKDVTCHFVYKDSYWFIMHIVDRHMFLILLWHCWKKEKSKSSSIINCGLTTFSDKVFDYFFQFHLMNIYFYLNIFIIFVKNGPSMDFISHYMFNIIEYMYTLAFQSCVLLWCQLCIFDQELYWVKDNYHTSFYTFFFFFLFTQNWLFLWITNFIC